MSRKNRKKQRPVVTGILSKHKKGFGFVIPDEGSFDRDIFISPSDMNGAMEGDRVEVDLIPEYLWEQSPQGIITKVTDRKLKEVAENIMKIYIYPRKLSAALRTAIL